MKQLSSAEHLDTPALNDHIPHFLEELAVAFQSQSRETIPEALEASSAPAHGLQRLQEAFDLEEVVAEYNILRGCLHDLAEKNGLSLQGEPFHILNRVLDQAIGLAVQTYATQRALEVQRRREEYLAFVAHDLRTPLNAISLATRVLEVTFREPSERAESGMGTSTLPRIRKTLISEQKPASNSSGANLTCGLSSRLSSTIFVQWLERAAPS